MLVFTIAATAVVCERVVSGRVQPIVFLSVHLKLDDILTAFGESVVDGELKLGTNGARGRHSHRVADTGAGTSAGVVLASMKLGANVKRVQITVLEHSDEFFHSDDEAKNSANALLNLLGKFAANLLASASNAHLQDDVQQRIQIHVKEVLGLGLARKVERKGEKRERKKKRIKTKNKQTDAGLTADTIGKLQGSLPGETLTSKFWLIFESDERSAAGIDCHCGDEKKKKKHNPLFDVLKSTEIQKSICEYYKLYDY